MSDIDPKHIEFFNELKELLKKHKATIGNTRDHIIFTFKDGSPKGSYYQTPWSLRATDIITNCFDCLEIVTTERVFK